MQRDLVVVILYDSIYKQYKIEKCKILRFYNFILVIYTIA